MLRFKSFLEEKFNFNVLKHNDLTKRGGGRIDVFLQKILDGDKFMTSKGLVTLDPDLHAELAPIMRNKGLRRQMSGTMEDGRAVNLAYPTDFIKSPEFGGKGAGFGTAAEDRHLSAFQKEINDIMASTGEPTVKLRINGRTVQMAGIISTPQRGRRAPKSDFSIVDAEGNEVAWLSHKDGKKPTDFQQYGGLSDSTFDNNKDLVDFLLKLKEMYPKGMERKTSAFRPCKDRNVILKSVFGVDYGKAPGHENVDEFHQGQMKLKKKGKNYEIVSHHKGVNGDVPKGGGYECIYYARFTSDRGANVAGMFIDNARIGVFPRANAAKTAKQI